MAGRPSTLRAFAIAASAAFTQFAESSYVVAEQSARKFGDGAMSCTGFAGGIVPSVPVMGPGAPALAPATAAAVGRAAADPAVAGLRALEPETNIAFAAGTRATAATSASSVGRRRIIRLLRLKFAGSGIEPGKPG